MTQRFGMIDLLYYRKGVYNVSLNIFYFQQITSYTVQYIQFIRKLGLKPKRKLIEFFSYYRLLCDMESGLYHVSYQFVVNMITH